MTITITTITAITLDAIPLLSCCMIEGLGPTLLKHVENISSFYLNLSAFYG
jgi:hypothetical protein